MIRENAHRAAVRSGDVLVIISVQGTPDRSIDRGALAGEGLARFHP
jgi:hypothetical protein